MGYRHYFYLVDKSEVENVKDLDMKSLTEYAAKQGAELYEEGEGFCFSDDVFMRKTQVFEFGKLYWDDTADKIYKTGLPLFAKPEVQTFFDDYVPFVVGKEGLIEAIKIYHKKARDYYNGLKSDADIKTHIREKVNNLRFEIADVDESNKWKVCKSWEYEHAIFNLAHLLKMIDWEKQTLLFYGY